MSNNHNVSKPYDDQLPPGQQLVAPGKWPIVGERFPAAHDQPWTIKVCVPDQQLASWTFGQLRNMPSIESAVDIHCVTRWSKLGVRFRGITLATLLSHVNVPHDSRFISFVAASERNHSTSLPLSEAFDLQALIALECEGKPLPSEHGGPVRMIVPGKYFYKSVKWLTRIDLLPEDRLGYWEAEAGYHNGANPATEQRYIAASVAKQKAERLIRERNLHGEDLLGLDVSHRHLAELNATSASLRNARFLNCNLELSRFDESNLSNANFEGANLNQASFVGADCEGANFCGADLRGANFAEASLLAATFSPHALIDSTTQISRQQIGTLLPKEAGFGVGAIGYADCD